MSNMKRMILSFNWRLVQMSRTICHAHRTIVLARLACFLQRLQRFVLFRTPTSLDVANRHPDNCNYLFFAGTSFLFAPPPMDQRLQLYIEFAEL